ncbi:hypothetical protein AB0O28_25255 [Microbispora sp. NPDC088329]|uniref:hypothetical protein n=1 Tax=Microbispora sp. NPDC088329 TaxID=3154869 RepID=UPI00343AAF61
MTVEIVQRGEQRVENIGALRRGRVVNHRQHRQFDVVGRWPGSVMTGTSSGPATSGVSTSPGWPSSIGREHQRAMAASGQITSSMTGHSRRLRRISM